MIGQDLIKQDFITTSQLNIAVEEQRKKPEFLGELLLKLGFVSNSELLLVLENYSDFPLFMDDAEPELNIESITPSLCKDICLSNGVCPIRLDGITIRFITTHLNISNKQIQKVIDFVFRLGFEAKFFLTTQNLLGFYQAKVWSRPIHSFHIQDSNNSNEDSNIETLLSRIFEDAYYLKASDIHFELELGYVQLRYRIDGVLQKITEFHKDVYKSLLIRIKVLSELDIAESRLPQDGHLNHHFSSGVIDFRISTMPVHKGENVVLRLLDRRKNLRPFDKLNLTDEAKQLLLPMIKKSEGIVLITGPTGSGKTTLLYSILQSLDLDHLSVLTLEDPVEYVVKGIRQSPINKDIGFDFIDGVRAQLRQDPDVIFIGEIRDSKTAQIAVRAALTGHKVYATLHCGSAFSAFPRLMDLGVKVSQLAGNLAGIVAQRLVRKKCRCGGNEFCRDCFNGYSGRAPLVEALQINPEFEELMYSESNLQTLKNCCTDNFWSLQQDAEKRLATGVTDLKEIQRCIDY